MLTEAQMQAAGASEALTAYGALVYMAGGGCSAGGTHLPTESHGGYLERGGGGHASRALVLLLAPVREL